MELLERYTGQSGTTSVSLYYYEDSNDYVITYHYTRPTYIAFFLEDIKYVEEMSTSHYDTARALYYETCIKAERHERALADD